VDGILAQAQRFECICGPARLECRTGCCDARPTFRVVGLLAARRDVRGQVFSVHPRRRSRERLCRVELAPRTEIVRYDPRIRLVLLGKLLERLPCLVRCDDVIDNVGVRSDDEHEDQEERSHRGSPM